jgi:signal transduction histidine kinase
MTRLPALPPRVLDVVAAAACVATMCVELVRNETPSALGVVAIVVASLPILIRRQQPVAALVLAFVTLVGVINAAHIHETIPFPAVICAYALAEIRGRRAAVVAGLVSAAAVLVILAYYSPYSLTDGNTFKNLGLVALPLALGVAAHDRRVYTAALLERAETAEQNREEEALRRVGEERLRIARDVHDVVAHAMVAINVQSGVGAHLLDRDPEQARGTLRVIKQISGDVLGDLRSTLGLLREGESAESAAPVHPLQGIGEIDDLRERLGSAGVELDVQIDPEAALLPPSVGATCYRIVQEALTNVMRHAGPTSARVRVSRRDDLVAIEVEDDGGSAPTLLDGTGSGNGLRGMRERAVALGGSFEAGPRAEGGWRVSASFPVGAP